MTMDPDIINYFHHIHHIYKDDDDELEHEVHHCGGDHSNVNLGYTIRHCRCKKHRIDIKRAIGHDVDSNKVLIVFIEKCPDGGYHVESGVLDKECVR
jgi:hypothetical protein